jgi:DNA-directed RNA polymerase beta subunit
MHGSDASDDDLLGAVHASFAAFTQAAVDPDARAHTGLERCLRERFPVRDFLDLAEVAFVRYHFEEPPVDVAECRRLRRTWARDLRVTLCGVSWVDRGGVRDIRDVVEETVTLCAIPWMTERGTFVIKGVERAVHAQLARCPGPWFGRRLDRDDVFRTVAHLETFRGPRLEVERTRRGLLRARFGQRAWFPATTLARALGRSREEILQRAYPVDRLLLDGPLRLVCAPGTLVGRRVGGDLYVGGELLAKRHRKVTRVAAKRYEAAGSPPIPIDTPWFDRALADDVVDPATGAVLARAGEQVAGVIDRARACGVASLPVLCASPIDPWGRMDVDPAVLDTVRADNCSTEEARATVLQALGVVDAAALAAADAERMLRHRLGQTERYDLTDAGRARMNRVLGTRSTARTLEADDVVATLVALSKRGAADCDDPDDLTGAVVRSVGELLAERFAWGLERLATLLKERLSMRFDDVPIDLYGIVDGAPITRALGDFFARSRVSRRAAVHSPIARVAQARWLAAVEPDPVSQRRTGFALDDTSATQLGLLCPIEPPSLPGSALALGATLGHLGALESPFVAQSESPPCITDDHAWIGAVAALVPFAVHNSAEAWMRGCASLREALPPRRARPPRVATPLDRRVAADSRFPEGHGVTDGTLACGDDLLVALMPWRGFTDERAIVVSERVVRASRLCVVRDGRLIPLAVGDVLGSRHGDRGVVALIAPEEDLPMLPDGRAVEAVIHPAAVLDPGAVGMLCEMAAEAPCVVAATTRSEREVPRVWLRDGRSGERFDAPVAVGTLHLLRLPPLVEDVAEARSRGPREVTTRQPKGDASHRGGQMLEEDAVWALVAHGAAWTLRESLTARSDDERAAAAVDRAIAAGESATPEAVSHTFEVFLRTVQAMGLAVEAPRQRRRSALR